MVIVALDHHTDQLVFVLGITDDGRYLVAPFDENTEATNLEAMYEVDQFDVHVFRDYDTVH